MHRNSKTQPEQKDSDFSSTRSRRFSFALSSSTSSRKSTSAHPTTSNASPPRTYLSSPRPVPIPIERHRQELARTHPFDRVTSASAPTQADFLERALAIEQHPRITHISPRQEAKPSLEDRRPSYNLSPSRELEESMPGGMTGGQKWAPAVNEQGKAA